MENILDPDLQHKFEESILNVILALLNELTNFSY